MTPITKLPADLWSRADELHHYAPVIQGRKAQVEAKRAVFSQLQRGSVEGLRDALTAFCASYQRDANGRLIPLAKNHLVNEASLLRDEIEVWQEARAA